MQVERRARRSNTLNPLSGERVSNALVTCPKERDNSPKGLLIPDVIIWIRSLMIKGACSALGGACVPSASW